MRPYHSQWRRRDRAGARACWEPSDTDSLCANSSSSIRYRGIGVRGCRLQPQPDIFDHRRRHHLRIYRPHIKVHDANVGTARQRRRTLIGPRLRWIRVNGVAQHSLVGRRAHRQSPDVADELRIAHCLDLTERKKLVERVVRPRNWGYKAAVGPRRYLYATPIVPVVLPTA